MALLRNILTFIPALLAGVLLIFEQSEPVIALGLLVAWGVIYAIIFAVVSGKDARSLTFWFLFLPPLLLVTGTGIFLLLLEQAWLQILMIVLVPVLVAIYSYMHLLFVRQPGRYQPYSLEYLSILINLLVVFLYGSSMIGYVSFMSLPQWTVVVAMFGLSGLLIAETLWVSKISDKQLPGLVFIGSILMAEAAAALVLLPVSFLVGGSILTIIYYVVLGMFRAHALVIVNRRTIQRYATIGIVGLLLVVSTARWI